MVVGSLVTQALSIYGIVHRDPCSRSSGVSRPAAVVAALLTVGMFLWIAIVWRGMRARLKNESKTNMPWVC